VLRRLIPDTLAGRTIIILLFGLGLFHLWSIWIYQLGIEDLLGTTREEQLAERLVSVKRVVAALPEGEREQTAHALSTATMEIHWSPRSLVNPTGTESRRIALVRRRLRELVPELADQQVRLAFADEGGSAERAGSDAFHHLLLASVQLPDGSWLNFSVATLRLASAPDHGVLGSLSAMALGILLVSVFLVRSVTAPLRSLANAADRIGVEAASPDLPQAGPREVRLAAAAFNRMQARIKRLIDDRTQTLAAVSHDLKTPITRLRLRAHFVRDDELRQTIESDLDEMEAMIQSTLDFLRGEATGEEIRTVDIGTIVETVCDQLVDSGHDVVLRTEAHAPLACRPLAIKRAVSNLVENAVKYGTRARVELAKRADALVVTIDDDGPGIPADELDRVFDPFYRLEASRSRETGGTGLGLTVARSTIRAHGGDVELANRDGGGLSVTVTLPMSAHHPRGGNTS
jgi:signal transduction histidine kinase